MGGLGGLEYCYREMLCKWQSQLAKRGGEYRVRHGSCTWYFYWALLACKQLLWRVEYCIGATGSYLDCVVCNLLSRSVFAGTSTGLRSRSLIFVLFISSCSPGLNSKVTRGFPSSTSCTHSCLTALYLGQTSTLAGRLCIHSSKSTGRLAG